VYASPAKRKRPVHVWRLLITYPAGSQEPGFRPYCWGNLLAEMDWRQRIKARRRGFRWPPERTWLSESPAEYRAWWLTRCGATVVLQKSAAVQWEDAESRLVSVAD